MLLSSCLPRWTMTLDRYLSYPQHLKAVPEAFSRCCARLCPAPAVADTIMHGLGSSRVSGFAERSALLSHTHTAKGLELQSPGVACRSKG